MRRILNNDKGYSLLITLAILILFTILGLSLSVLTSSGIAKNEVRQDIVQSKDLSEKGTKYLTNEISTSIKNELGDGKTILEFENLLFEILENPVSSKYKYNCPNMVDIQGSLGNTKTCIEKVEIPSPNIGDKLKRIVTIKSIGEVENGKKHTSYSKILVGSDAIPEQLNYAISTNNDGNLFLFGGVDVTGDIKTDGNLYLGNSAFSGYLNNPKWKSSTYPKLTRTAGNSYPKIILKQTKKISRFDSYPQNNDFNTYVNNPTIKYVSTFDPSKLETQEIVQKMFKDGTVSDNTKPRIVVQTVNQDSINIEKIVKDVGIKPASGKLEKHNKTLTIKGYHNSKEYKNEARSFGNSTTEYYINGDLLIGRYAGTDTIDNTAGNYTELTLEGKYYVTGKVHIKGVKLKGNTEIYSIKETDITSSTIEGYNKGTNFIFSNGLINISNISTDSSINNPSRIDGFFYSNDNLLMYGFGSNISITGGISANRIILTALRGQANSGNTSSESRLRVNYDNDIITKYLNNRSEDTQKITTTLTPKVLDISITPYN